MMSKIVNIPDENLREAIKSELGLTSDNEITEEAMAGLIRLNADYKGIEDLAGLEDAVNLKTLDLSNNDISDISPLEGLVKLKELNLDWNVIDDLLPLADLMNLQWLSLWRNRVYNIEPLVELTNLVWLNLEDNTISDITPLADSENLAGGLWVFGNDDVDYWQMQLLVKNGILSLEDAGVEEEDMDLDWWNPGEKLGSWENDSWGLNSIRETLYEYKNDTFLFHGEGGASTKYRERCGSNSWCEGELIRVIGIDEAKEWVKENLSDEKYIEIFGEPEEA